MSSVVWDLRTALRDLFSEALDVPVYDGPVSRTTLPKAYVLVGSDGGENGDGSDGNEGSVATQEWANIAGRRTEDGEIVCSVWAWSGSTKFAPIRAQVDSVLTTIEATLHTNRQMADVLTGGAVGLSRVSIRERHVDDAAVVRAVCIISYRSLLT